MLLLFTFGPIQAIQEQPVSITASQQLLLECGHSSELSMVIPGDSGTWAECQLCIRLTDCIDMVIRCLLMCHPASVMPQLH